MEELTNKFDWGKKKVSISWPNLLHSKVNQTPLHSGKVYIDTAHYGAIWLMFDTFHNAGQHVSAMILTVKLKGILLHQNNCLP